MAEPFKNLISSKTCALYYDAVTVLQGPIAPGLKHDWNTLSARLEPLELRQRVSAVSELLDRTLGKGFAKYVGPLLAELKAKGAEGFNYWPYADWIERYGQEYWQESFEAMREVTPVFTAEFAVRPFLIADPQRALSALTKAAKSADPHLRRWSSEGLRPRLPWGTQLKFLIQDPTPCLEILEILKFDSSLYVRKSVANHLNDITKDHPELVIETLNRWSKDCPQGYQREFQFLLNRALRTLVKAGDPGALRLLGFESKDHSRLRRCELRLASQTVRVPEAIEFEVTLAKKGAKPLKLVVDYQIGFRLKNGAVGHKTFKWKNLELKGDAEFKLKKKHSFRPITTRTYYPGVHTLTLLVNGKSKAVEEFRLLPKN